jgi:hypothetical protein
MMKMGRPITPNTLTNNAFNVVGTPSFNGTRPEAVNDAPRPLAKPRPNGFARLGGGFARRGPRFEGSRFAMME